MPQIEAPAESLTALESPKGYAFCSELHVSQIPPPMKIAPWAVALQAEINDFVSFDPDSYRGNTRFILLYDPEGQSTWDDTIRIVTYVNTPVESDMDGDPLLDEVSWIWSVESLEARGARHHNLAGTVTRNYSETSTGMHTTDSTIDLEVRASRSPDYVDASVHLDAWVDLAASVCGLGPDDAMALPRSSRAP